MVRGRILIADDEADFRELLVRRMNRKGYLATGVPDGTRALAVLRDQAFDVAVLDLRMPGADGLQVLTAAREAQPNLEVIMLTGHGRIEDAIQAMKLGAYDFLTKPCNLSELDLVVEKALERRELAVQNAGLREALRRQEQGEIVGHSPALQEMLELVRRVAATDSTVLVQGESGTGKELVARAIHRWSGRSGGPLQVVNVAALPTHLVESELFGHAKGAFTGAAGAKPGLAELAHGGTLFLDEIGELSAELQPKLLRFLETGEVRRVGETQTRYVDVRVVAATNRSLAQMVARGEFREDLYFRLNVVSVTVPPLRERREDIPLLAEHFLAARPGPRKRFSPEALAALQQYDFPGNIRELRNLVDRGAILARGEVITLDDLQLPALVALAPVAAGAVGTGNGSGARAMGSAGGSGPSGVHNSGGGSGTGSGGPLAGSGGHPTGSLPGSLWAGGGTAVPEEEFPTLEELERRHIAAALARTGGNRARAAELLGISVRSLYRKLGHSEE